MHLHPPVPMQPVAAGNTHLYRRWPGFSGLSLLQQRQPPCLAQRYQQTASRGVARKPINQPPAAAAGAAAAGASTAAPLAQGFFTGLLYAWHTSPAQVLLAVSAFLLGLSLSVFLLAAIPGILALRRAALAMEALLHVVRQEVPDTASTLRLSGVELADCIEEVSMLSNDLTQGVRSTARAIASAEQGVRQGVDLAGKAVSGYVVPKIREAVPEARGKLQSALEERARLNYTAATIRDVASATRSTAQRLRMGLAALGLVSRAAGVVQEARRSGAVRRSQQEIAEGSSSNGRVPTGTYGGRQSLEWEG